MHHDTETTPPLTASALDDEWPFQSAPSTVPKAPVAASHEVANLTARNEQMAEMALAGATLQEIGDTYGVTRERVRQILDTRYGITGGDMVALRRAMKAEGPRA